MKGIPVENYQQRQRTPTPPIPPSAYMSNSSDDEDYNQLIKDNLKRIRNKKERENKGEHVEWNKTDTEEEEFKERLAVVTDARRKRRNDRLIILKQEAKKKAHKR